MTQIIIEPSGAVSYIYDDNLIELSALGDGFISRASYVEPTESGAWVADMGGALLGPYRTRGEALQAEMDWLERQMRS